MSNNKLIPELRFPEFKNEGEWLQKKLGEIGEPLMCKRILKEQTTTNSKNGIPFYKIGTFGKEADAYIPIKLFEEFKNKYSFPKNGDILISAAGTIGRLVVYNGLPAYFQDSNIVWLGNDESMVLNSYLFHCYSTIKWQTSDGGIISRLYNSDLKNIKIFYSKNTEEQQKIASCLSSLDEVIAAHSQKLDLLKHHKKGLMQNLFPQSRLNCDSFDSNDENDFKNQSNQENHKNHSSDNIPKYRFKEFENDGGEWVEKKLGEVAIFLKGKGISKSDIVEGGNLPCIRYGELYTHYKETIDAIKSFTNLSSNELVLSESNDVIIPASGETQIDIATASCVLKSGIALGGDLNIIRSGIDGVFLAYYLNSAKKSDIAQLAQGISVVHLYPSQLQTLSISFPKNQKEQQKIASCLSSLDALITAQAKRIEQLKIHKKGLMQGLFPKMSE